MKKMAFLFIVSILSFTRAEAQRLVFVFGHAEYASATGDLKSSNDRGLGVEAGVGLGVRKTFFMGTLGYTWLRTADNSPNAGRGTLRYAPVKLGIRQYLFRRNLFIKADAGLANMKYANLNSGSSHFTAGGGVGVKFTGMEVLGEYTTVTGGYGSWLSVKAGFTIGL